MEASNRKILTHQERISTTCVIVCWFLNFSRCLFFIHYSLHAFSHCQFFASVFKPLLFFWSFLLHFSSHFISFTHWENFQTRDVQGNLRWGKSDLLILHFSTEIWKKKKKGCPQTFTTNTAPFKPQLSAVRSVFSSFFLCMDPLINFVPALFSFTKYWKKIETPLNSNWQIIQTWLDYASI